MVRSICFYARRVALFIHDYSIHIFIASFVSILTDTLDGKSTKTLFRKRRKQGEEDIAGHVSAAKTSDDAADRDSDANIFARKSPYECCIDSEVDGRILTIEEYSAAALECISDITTGVDTCILTLLLVLGEGVFLESRPGQARLVGFLSNVLVLLGLPLCHYYPFSLF